MQTPKRKPENKIPVDQLEKHLLEDFETSIDTQKRAMIALLFAGKKPGEEVKFLDDKRARNFENFIESTDLEHVSYETDFYTKYFITPEKRFLDILDRKEDKGYSLKSIARFKGFPEPIPEKIHRNPSRGLKNSFSPEEKDDQVTVEGNEHLIDLAGFNPTDWDEMQKAVEIGEKRQELLRQMDKKHETEIGKSLLEKLRKSN